MDSQQQKKSWGGQRPGAGRPGTDSRTYTFRAPAVMADFIDAQPEKTAFIRRCISRDMYEDIWNPSYMIMGDLWTKLEERRKGYATYCFCKLYEQGDKHGIGSCRCEADVDSPGRIFLEHCRRRLSEAYCEEYIRDQKYQLKIGGSEFFAQELQFTPTLIEK